MSSTDRFLILTSPNGSRASRWNRGVLTFIASLVTFGGSFAVDRVCFAQPADPFRQAPPPASPATPGGPVDAEEAAIVERLDQLQSPRFAERRRAASELRSLGASAHPALENAALSNRPDRAIAALDLLKDALDDPQRQTADSARECLRRIAQTQGSAAAIARQALRRADRAGADPTARQNGPGLPQLMPPIPNQPPGFAPRGRTNLRISIRNVNGVREIEVIENDRAFRFKDVQGGLRIERPDGNGGVERKVYEDAEALKQNDPDAYEKYQKAGGGGGGNLGGNLNLRPRSLLEELFGPPALRNPRQVPPPPAAKPDGPRIELHPEIAPRPAPRIKPQPQRERIGV